ncbi:MAG: PRC-barrel domain-containing protein [Nitrincola lacisaponensis]|uniref:PRC-barrel domain-containing protein n=1 Tax=Nitrincola lacisaponensis TaxID=267850 RepID=UPI00391925FE
MNKLNSCILYAFTIPAIVFVTSALHAQQPATQESTRAHQGTQIEPSGMLNRGHISTTPVNGIKASNLLGTKVQTQSDEEIGSVNELIIDANGQVVAILIGVGGFLGVGEKDVAIGWGHITRSGTADKAELRVDLSADDLRSAPKFE